MNKIKTPVLLIGFNRPDDIRQSFEAIRKVQPSILYVAIDGARDDKIGEKEKVIQVQNIVKNVDWNCETHYRFSEKNLGCEKNIPSAISWVFEKEDRVIIVEDDIVAPPSFFMFEEQMLEKYKADDRIAMVSGNNYTPIKSDYDYLFSLYAGHIWGWGTWKRLWERFDVEVPSLNSEIADKLPKINKFTTSITEYCYLYKYYSDLREAQMVGEANYWGPQFSYFRLVNGLLNIVPKVNLASNVGNVSSRDSNNDSAVGQYFYESHNEFSVEKEPSEVKRNVEYDRYHFKKHLFQKSFIKGKFWVLYTLFMSVIGKK